MSRSERRAQNRFSKAFHDGIKFQNTGDVAKAQQCYRRALRYGDDPMIHNNLGVMAHKAANLNEAVKCYRRAVALAPGFSEGWNNLGVVLCQKGDYQDAEHCYAKGMEDPACVAAFSNMSEILCRNERYAEALDLLAHALERKPDFADALANAGVALWGLNQYDLAIESFHRAIKAGGSPTVHMCLGLLLLQIGNYTDGWSEYAWRFAAGPVPMRGGSLPVWDGQSAPKGRLLVWGEQGLGDEILHGGAMHSLAKYAADNGFPITWECEPRLLELYRRSVSGIDFIPRRAKTALGDCVEQIPVGCLSQLRTPTEPRLSYLTADEKRRREFKLQFPLGKRIVGISWKSKNEQFGGNKSLALADLSNFLENDGYYCIDLQYGDTSVERQDWPQLHHLDLDLTQDIDGLAALISACDLVVTVSNTTAHLAGALGVPTLVLVSARGGKLWYWGTEEKTNWYESVTIQRFER